MSFSEPPFAKQHSSYTAHIELAYADICQQAEVPFVDAAHPLSSFLPKSAVEISPRNSSLFHNTKTSLRKLQSVLSQLIRCYNNKKKALTQKL